MGSVTAVAVATTWGFTTVLVAFLLLYWLGAAAFAASWRRAQPSHP